MTSRARWVIGSVAALAALLVGYYAVTVLQVWRAARADDTRPSDAIIVLGAAQYDGRPSAVFRARLDHALDLYEQGVAPIVVVTGGKLAGDRFTEAGAGADYLIAHGVPDADILRETTSRNSWESLRASARFLFARDVRRVVLVSDPFHSLRIRLTAEEVGFDAVTSPTRSSPIRGASEWRRFLGEGLRVALGRIFGFGRATRLRESRVGLGAGQWLS
ncbi:MAG: YdcF family protein [Acidimicrobiia bacterium]